MPPKPKTFKVVSDFAPAGDQPKAIEFLTDGINKGEKNQVLLGVTGSGKTFTMAHVIANTGKPALIMAHNKTLAAQLYAEFKSFFPENAVEYFVSYYDYYQPEAYVPKTDTFIEKDSSINEQIDRMRHSATRALLERRDVIVVASVSCIYGLGSPEHYMEMRIPIEQGKRIDMGSLARLLVEIQYTRNDIDFSRGSFRIKGDVLDIFPSHLEDRAWRLSFFGDEIESIIEFDPLTGERVGKLPDILIFANSHHVTTKPTLFKAIESIKKELKQRLDFMQKNNMLLEAQRLEQRTAFDIEMMLETGTCRGIENYSRYMTGRSVGEPPPTLFEYIPKDAILFVDESHVTVSQVGGMYNGDRSRKTTLVEHGFRLPSALDNRPLKSEEWNAMRPQTIFVSATPAKWEIEAAHGRVVEQVIRPTGLIDPEVIIRPVTPSDGVQGQVDDLLAEVRETIKKGFRVLVTTLTKKMAENLTEYMQEIGIKVAYLHSDVDTLDRIEIIRDLRKGVFDVLVGINLLREGLDIPECGMVGILDADKAGFLRSETSLIQTIGRAARNADARVILYADVETDAIKKAVSETNRRRGVQMEYNKLHGITPKTVIRTLEESMSSETEEQKEEKLEVIEKDMDKIRKAMLKAAQNLEFEQAAKLRDTLRKLEHKAMGV